uniref:competence protein CoiA family protein n=1 Tax=Streptomyces virginiae TaxID=1961 RepID=UPI002F90843E
MRFMPFTALHPDLGRLDATLADLRHKLDWAQIHKARPRIQLACPECDWTLHPKVSRYGVRFFCHDPGRPPSCELSNESWEHHMLKLDMAGAIRAAGWFATLEVPAEDGSWRADVMATSTDGTQRMAWEAQLSPITLDDIQARTDRYLDEGVRVCWVSPHKRSPRWISAVPAVRVHAPEEHEPQLWIVDDGLAGFDYGAGRWMFREEELVQFVRWALHGQVLTVESMPRYRRVYRVVDGEQRQFRRGQWWTSAQSAAAQEKHNAMGQRQELAREERKARQKQLEEEADRQSRLRAEQEQARRAEQAERLREKRAEEYGGARRVRRRW